MEIENCLSYNKFKIQKFMVTLQLAERLLFMLIREKETVR